MKAAAARAILLTVTALLISQAALAQVAAVVEGVQMPAWLERGGQRAPLMPGMALRAGDQIATGPGARLLVKLADGSLVKLGENAQLRLTELSPSRELFKAALNVLEGAFRFTTELVAKNLRREVSIRAAQVTAGIRGTDVWGRARSANEIVCLLEGEVEVTADGERPVKMDQARQFYRRVSGKAQPLGQVDEKQVEQWSAETDLQAGKGIVRRGGRFSVTAMSADDQDSVLDVYDKLREAGYPAEIRTRKSGEKTVYSVRIRQLPSQAEAQALLEQLRGKFGLTDAKVSG